MCRMHTAVMMKGFKFEPVRWATVALAFVTALIGANELVHDLTDTDIVPAGLTPYLLAAEALLALLLGQAVRKRVTPLAEPRTAWGDRMVPAAFRQHQAPPTGEGVSQR